jgi:hypothetical protein
MTGRRAGPGVPPTDGPDGSALVGRLATSRSVTGRAIVAPWLRSGDGEVEQLRRRLHDVFAGGEVSGASVDDWELVVVRYGMATKDRPATLLLGDLAGDIAELERTMTRCRSLSA